MNGLVWRSRQAHGGLRRVNYFFRHLMIDTSGGMNKTFHWLDRAKDPRLVCHPILICLADLVWENVVCRTFVVRKGWLLCNFILFIISQSLVGNVRRKSSW